MIVIFALVIFLCGMSTFLLMRWVDNLYSTREVIREADGTPYLVRYFISKPKSKTKGRIYLHHILRSDHDRALHDHPWGFTSFLLKGRYLEIADASQALPGNGWLPYRDASEHLAYQLFESGDRLVRPADWRHRLVIAEGKSVWSLVFTTNKQRSWGFWPNGKFCPWKRYDNALGICEDSVDIRKNLTLHRHEQFSGYDWAEIEEHMPSPQFKRFDKWMRGQTVAILEGKKIVYAWDLDRFLAGKPVVD